MRVCLVARRFYESNSHMQQFAKALVARGDTVDVVAARRRDLPGYEVCDGVNVHRIRERNIEDPRLLIYLFKLCVFMIHASLFVARRHLRLHYDLVHVQSIPDILVLSALVPKFFGTPVILDLRDLVPELYSIKFRPRNRVLTFKALVLLEKCSAAFADHVIVANPIWFERIAKRSASRSKCTMIWYCPDLAAFYPRPKRRQDRKFVILYPGTLSWHQGVDILVRAFPKIAAEIPEAELHIHGEGAAKEALADLAKQIGVAERVQFFDWVPTASLIERMAASDLAVVPKRTSGGFGNEAASTKIPEFMAMGIAVVAARTAVESLFFDDAQIRYFRSEDEDDLVRAVVSVYRDPKLRERLIGAGIEAVKQADQSVKESYLHLVDSLVRPKARVALRHQVLPTLILNRIYYTVRPVLPVALRMVLRRRRAISIRRTHADVWPIDENAGATPPEWPGWPTGKRFALVLTHDVEGSRGLGRVERLMDLEWKRGFRSSFNFVPEGEYRVPEALRRTLEGGGFEVGVHGLKHDGKLYNSKASFSRRVARIKGYLRQWGACGFRSPSMQHRLAWLHQLGVEYDCSTFDTDPFEPEPDGARTIFPFWVPGPDGSGYVELPYSLPQDFTLFALFREQNIDIWKKKLDWVAAHGGMALLDAHPDYMAFDGELARDEYPASHYEEFLRYAREKYDGLFWAATPRQVARYYRAAVPVSSHNTRK